MTFQAISSILRRLADPAIATQSQRFFKTGKGEYSEGDQFLGIRVPVLREQAKKFENTPLTAVQELLESPFHEERLCALLILVRKFTKGNPEEQTRIYTLYLKDTQYINNWDLVDLSAYHIVGPYLENRDRRPLHKLAQSKSLWKRRIAIISTFHFIRNNQFEETLAISEQLLNDSEDLIHKAVGWMLREIGKRDLATEEAFLKQHYKQMPRTMLRYAIEKFPEPKRQKYLKGFI
ncbi:DNA alkylation repair protein [Acaryochloris thomasi]|nr:DNA alkylation repair protein [Acaryochloris thomasi]